MCVTGRPQGLGKAPLVDHQLGEMADNELVSGYVIRPARPGDGRGVAQAWLDFAEYYREIAPEAFQAPRADGLAEWLEDRLLSEQADVFGRVCDDGGEAVGFVRASFLPPHEDAERQVTREVALPRIYVNAIAVRRDHWRGGAGTALMRSAEAWGRERGARLISLDTFAASPVSVPFYEKRMGYERHAIIFSGSLD
ncbi:GNAT family N-acetyltransferase [Actinomadura decatromicini]|uniref:GNAT family N-acetyltransferase n=1 Tax=Actinomadura decatromicini TaxID=2604572 RepID=A0A5D3F5V8_9ACTN|nr:GNAT family N-acetyltransferase [Actinomadura decatromicini]